MMDIASPWSMDLDRGPDCLFVRVSCPDESAKDGADLAGELWTLLQRHFTYRLVLECDEMPALCSATIGQLVSLNGRIAEHDGMLRLCGLSEENRSLLAASRLEAHFPHYRDRTEAVMGFRPCHPR